MSRKTLHIAPNAEIRISQLLGNLSVTGWGESTVALETKSDDLKAEGSENMLSVSCTSDCTLNIPQSSRLQIAGVHGDASLRDLAEPVSIQTIYGSFSMRNMGGASIESIHGNLSAKEIRGDVQAQKIDGNAYFRDIQGDCMLEQVSGNLDVRDAGGNLRAKVDGDARLHLSQLAGTVYAIQADGNVHCHIPEEANLTLTLSSKDQVIRIKLPGETSTVRQEKTELILGNGEKRMELSAGGGLYLSSQSIEWGEIEFPYEGPLPEHFSQQIFEQVQSQIDSQMETIHRHLNERIATLTEQFGKSDLPPDQIQHIIDQARLASEREIERSEHKMRRAQEKMERKLESTRRRQEHSWRYHGKRSWNFNFDSRPRSVPSVAVETATDEERLMILRMLEQKKISPEEAERLFSALEGN